MAQMQTSERADGRCAHLANANMLPSGTSPADRRTLLKNGYLPIPICGKGPRWSWRSEPVTAERIAKIETDPRFADHQNTGLVTGNLVAVDIDVRDESHVQTVSKAIVDVLGYTDALRIGSKGIVHLYHNPEPIKKITIVGVAPGAGKQEGLVEFLGDGQQVAAYGIHPITKCLYDWPNAYDGGEPLVRRLDQLPRVSPDMLCAATKAVANALIALGYLDVNFTGLYNAHRLTSSRRGEPVSLSWLVDALKCIPPSLKRDEWLRVLWAVRDANLVPNIDYEERIAMLDMWSSGALWEEAHG